MYSLLLKDSNPCYNNPCSNGGTCTNNGQGYTCTCKTDFYGDRCQFCKYRIYFIVA